MEHRYGRHGPRAWLRWRQRRYGRPVSLPVPVEPQPTVIHVHVPVNAERIILIIMSNELNPEWTPSVEVQETTGQTDPLGPVGSTYQISSPKQESEVEKLAQLKLLSYYAETDADQKARRDLARLDGIADDDELRAYAQRLWVRHEYARETAIREEAVAAGVKGHELFPLYESGLIAVYRSITKVAPPDSRLKIIRKQARADKKWDNDHQVLLDDDERMRQATICVFKHIDLDPRTERQEITRLVRAYESSYQQYDPAQEEMEGEEDRAPRSRGFR